MMKHILVLVLLFVPACSAEYMIAPFGQLTPLPEYQPLFSNTFRYVGIDGSKLYQLFEQLYNSFAALAVHKNIPKIPRIIHQIWLGSPVPDVFYNYMQSWQQLHPEWRYILWDDQKIAQLGLYNQDIFDASENYAQKADIARLEIIYRFGGIYADVDCECLQSFEPLLSFDFFVGIQPADSQLLQLNNALFGAIPAHPILHSCIKNLKQNYQQYRQVTQATGPIYLTRIFYETALQNNKANIALPACYFYPVGCGEYAKTAAQIDERAFAVHWWAKSWMPKKYRKPTFRGIREPIG